MNALEVRRIMPMQRRGMGDVGPYVDPVTFTQEYGAPPPMPGMTDGHSTRDFIGSLIGAGLQTVTNIWGRNNPITPGAQSANQTAEQQLLAYQQAQLLAAQQQHAGVGVGLDGSGIRLTDGSHIGWLPIVGVVVLIVALQSKPLSRR